MVGLYRFLFFPYFIYFFIFFLLLLFFVTSSSTLCLGWLLYQRICNTFSSLPYPCHVVNYLIHCIIFIFSYIYYFHNYFKLYGHLFFVLPLYMIMGRIKIILILIQMAIFLNLVKGKLLIICRCAHYIFMLFLLFIAVSQNECMLIIILLSTNRVKKGLGPNCPFYGSQA